MILTDFHTHTQFCDGKDTAEEMVNAAIRLGLSKIGFSGHSFAPFDKDYSLSEEGTEKYFEEINALKEKYKDKIQILCGIELDLLSEGPKLPFDYSIGSVHYLKLGDEIITVDAGREILIAAAKKYFGGDMLALAEEYYRCVAELKNRDIDIVGHIDLITKLNKDNCLFDEASPRYKNAAISAADALLAKNIPFEINTGAISRGYKDCPYPADFILKHIKEKGGSVIFSSDAHSKDNLCFEFDKWHKILKDKDILPPIVTL